MGLKVPAPDSDRDLSAAGMSGEGAFIVVSRDGHSVRIPDEWRVPLAAHLLAGTGVFDVQVVKYLRALQQRALKKRGNKVDAKDARVLGEIAHGMECLIQEYLEADPKTSRRYEYRPSYHRPHPGGDRDSEGILEGRKEEIDDTPAPWEAAPT